LNETRLSEKSILLSSIHYRPEYFYEDTMKMQAFRGLTVYVSRCSAGPTVLVVN